MDTSNILKPIATFNNSFISKVKRFIGSALLADWVLGNAIYIYIENLNSKGLLGLGADFRADSMIWGDTIWLNILHVLILAFNAGLFGLIFGYLSKRVSFSDKIIFITFYVFTRLIFLAIFSIIIENFIPNYASTWNEILSRSLFIVSSSVFNVTFIILGYIAMITSAFYFIQVGSKIINDPTYITDKTQNGTLLDIKWYHYLWLFIPISYYSQILLNMIYNIGFTIINLVRNFKWHTIFGGNDGEESNALDIAWFSLFFIILVAMIVLYLMNYLRIVLIDKTNHPLFVKILISIIIGFVIPLLIFLFTRLGG